ncbi:MAG: hypothetical protein LOD85_05445, partial [Clostridia bacterium]
MAADIQAMLLETARKLEERLGGEKPRALIGFDGFVDEIIDVVATRHSPTSYQRFATISQLAKRIADAAGLSTNLELVTTQVKLGGNGPIMANALAGLGVDVTYIGSVGYPAVHPVFEEFAAKCRVISICEPGHTDALEFDDGKLMLGKYQTLDQVRWERIVQLIPVPELAEIAGQAEGGGEELSGRLAAAEERLAGLVQAARGAQQSTAANAQRLDEINASLTALKGRVESQDEGPRLALIVAASALRSAVERGEPFAGELETYTALASDPAAVEPLTRYAETGIPTDSELAASASDAASRIVTATTALPPDASFLD